MSIPASAPPIATPIAIARWTPASADSLDEQRYRSIDGTLDGSFSGHPHRDPLAGERHAIAYDGSIWDAVRHAVLGGHAFPFRWNPDHRARVGLLPRQGAPADIIWCDIEPCFAFHVANAFDTEDGTVILDVIAYPTMFASGGSGLDALGQFERWTVDPSTRRVSRPVLDTTPQEFPRIDERRFGQSYRFVYTVSVPPDGNPQLTGATRLYKHDLETGSHRVHEFGDGRIPGEFVFVPARIDAEEDEGWLIGLVINTTDDTTDFAILDARRFEAPPVATVGLPHRIPPGFHGNWFPTLRPTTNDHKE